ncbi:STAS domain-containing protein [Saccharothrix sp. Mg75]|uniref:STAS domain-containing protein n=1 Tax=Saccharothrix sp. Mg75 TaxID=3445357 RepID=UPI003EEE6F4F
MTSSQLPSTATTSTTPGDAAVVRVTGEIDMFTSDDLFHRCASALDGGAAGLVVDLSEVTFFASSGIAALGRVREHNAAPRRPVHVVASRAVRRSLELTAMDRLLPLHDTADEALAAVRFEAHLDGAAG